MIKLHNQGLNQEVESNFSASYYGPVFPSMPSEPSIAIISDRIEHRYFYVHETHRNDPSFPNLCDLYSNMIRYFLLTFKDSKHRVCLHNACRFGDKHFVTMMVMEARYLGHQIVDEILDIKDKDQLTPFYLLCEHGYRKKEDFDEEEKAFLEGFEKTIAVELTIDQNNDGLEDNPE